MEGSKGGQQIRKENPPSKPEDRIPNLYAGLVSQSMEARSELSKISADREDFARFPDKAYKHFQDFIGGTNEELPDAIVYKNERDDKDTYYYFPKENKIYRLPSDISIYRKYDPLSEDFIGLDNVKREKEGDIFPFEGEEADIDSIDSILKSISPLLTTDQAKSLFQTTTETIDKLKQQFDADYNKKQNEWTQQIGNQTVTLLQEIRKHVGEKKMPAYVLTVPLFGLMGTVGRREIEPERKMPYLITNEGKIVKAPVIEQKLFFKIAYVPDLTKAEDADPKEWLNPSLPNTILNLMPRSVRRKADRAAKQVIAARDIK